MIDCVVEIMEAGMMWIMTCATVRVDVVYGNRVSRIDWRGWAIVQLHVVRAE